MASCAARPAPSPWVRKSSISAPDQIMAMGLAMFLRRYRAPSRGRARTGWGSLRSGFRLAEGARPIRAGGGRAQVAQDVAKQVGGGHHIKAPRLQHKAGGEDVDVLLVQRHIGVGAANRVCTLVPPGHADGDAVGLGGQRQGEIAADEGKARRRMACGKAVARAAVPSHAPAPVRYVVRPKKARPNNCKSQGQLVALLAVLDDAMTAPRQQHAGQQLHAPRRWAGRADAQRGGHTANAERHHHGPGPASRDAFVACMRILLVEDDAGIAEGLRANLQQRGHAVDWCGTIASAWVALTTEGFDAVLLDLGLPDGDGRSLLARLRNAPAPTGLVKALPDPATPVHHFEPAREWRATNRIEGLDQGADDYLPRPFDAEELQARLRALVRRARGPAPPADPLTRHGAGPGAAPGALAGRAGRGVAPGVHDFADLAAGAHGP
ncbi:hypothetical protein FQA39_LY18567 [Lamprigera yunnana]|nr:hypothetical protein FQA39_LY18567 [Lamprigera yunnana]